MRSLRVDGKIYVGARHGDILMQQFYPDDFYFGPNDQGFVDQHGKFLTRQQAWKIAEANGQILYRCGGDTSKGGTLYSENLY